MLLFFETMMMYLDFSFHSNVIVMYEVVLGAFLLECSSTEKHSQFSGEFRKASD